MILWYSNCNQKCLKPNKQNIFIRLFQMKLAIKSYIFSDEQGKFINKTFKKLFFDNSFHLIWNGHRSTIFFPIVLTIIGNLQFKWTNHFNECEIFIKCLKFRFFFLLLMNCCVVVFVDLFTFYNGSFHSDHPPLKGNFMSFSPQWKFIR